MDDLQFLELQNALRRLRQRRRRVPKIVEYKYNNCTAYAVRPGSAKHLDSSYPPIAECNRINPTDQDLDNTAKKKVETLRIIDLPCINELTNITQ